MVKEKLEFETRTAKITINYNQCEPAIKNTTSPSCEFACVKACRLYGRNVLKIEEGKPSLSVSDPAGIERLDNECLACEYECWVRGSGAIEIELPLSGINEYREKRKREKVLKEG